MSPANLRRTACLALLVGVFPVHVIAQDDTTEVQWHTVDAAPGAVTVYRDRAAITRSVTRPLTPGQHRFVFEDLPASLQPATLQARASGAASVIGVDFEERAGGGRVSELDAKIEAVRLDLAGVEEEQAVLDAQSDFIDAVTIRAMADAGVTSGTPALDLEAVRAQIEFVGAERTRLLEKSRGLGERRRERAATLKHLEAERGRIAGAEALDRSATVLLAVTADGEVTVDLVYLVADASWAPRYGIRARTDGSSVSIEYDALLTQRTGEDWPDVALTLSTAAPTIAAHPPRLEPWYVDVATPARSLGRGARPSDAAALAAGSADKSIAADMERLAADAEVGGAGPSVTFALPRRVTVRSDASKRQQTRIALIGSSAAFVHVATPSLTDQVYVRGELTNAGPYQLLPGEASIFVGPDFVGSTRLDGVAPFGAFSLYFGVDPAVRIDRVLVARTTAKTGLLGGGRKTEYEYRIEIDNGAGKSITLELWERIPVSRSDQIAIEVYDLSRPFATDVAYLEEDQPRGLLKWLLTVPPAPQPLVLTYAVRVSRGKDVEMTRLPE